MILQKHTIQRVRPENRERTYNPMHPARESGKNIQSNPSGPKIREKTHNSANLTWTPVGSKTYKNIRTNIYVFYAVVIVYTNTYIFQRTKNFRKMLFNQTFRNSQRTCSHLSPGRIPTCGNSHPRRSRLFYSLST